MAKWEYAAIVRDYGRTEWALRQGEQVLERYTEVILSAESNELLASFGKENKLEITSPTEFKIEHPPLVHSWNIHLNDFDIWGDLRSDIKGFKKLTHESQHAGYEKMFGAYIVSAKHKYFGQINKSLFKSQDILELINKAGAAGWEITGGIGYDDSEPGRHETRWRIMRREL
jgi:hypothetical protein